MEYKRDRKALLVYSETNMAFGYKKTLVIGATSGIGRAIAEKLVQNGISTIIAGRRRRTWTDDKDQARVVDILEFNVVWVFHGKRNHLNEKGKKPMASDLQIRVRDHQTSLISISTSSMQESNARSTLPRPRHWI